MKILHILSILIFTGLNLNAQTNEISLPANIPLEQRNGFLFLGELPEVTLTNRGLMLASSSPIITSDNKRISYLANENNSIKIKGKNRIMIRVDWFLTEAVYDKLEIYDGDDDKGNLLAELSGDVKNNELFISNSNTVFIKFTSNNELQLQGFRLNIQEVGLSPSNPSGIMACSSSSTNQPPADLCQNAPVICNLNDYCGTTSNYTADNTNIGSPNGSFCGSIENNSWLAFIASSTSASFQFTSQNCQDNSSGIQAIIYASTNCNQFTSVSNCQSQSNGAGTFTISTNVNLVIGQKYYIMVDGFAGNRCDYLIKATAGVSTNMGITPQNQTICPGTSATISATQQTTGGYTWSSSAGGTFPNSQSITVTPSATTTYTLQTGADACNPSGSTATATVTVSNTLPAPNVTAPSSVCQGATLNLSSLTTGNGYTYTWTGPNGYVSYNQNPTVNNFQSSNAGTYTLVVSGGPGCNSTPTSVNITMNPSPNVNLTASNYNVCSGQTVNLTASGISGSGNNYNYSWNPLQTNVGLQIWVGVGNFGSCQNNPISIPGVSSCGNATATPTTSTTICVEGKNNAGCRDTGCVRINVVPAQPITASNDTTICPGETATISAFGGSSYTWSANGNTIGQGASISVSPATTTVYTVTSPSCGGGVFTETVTVTVNSGTPISVTPSQTTICPGQTANLTASGATTYSWSPATGLSSTTGATVTASPTTTTIYTVTGFNGGCTSQAFATVNTVNSLPVAVNPTSSTICSGSTVTLTATGADAYSWSPATGLSSNSGSTVTANPNSTTTYTVTGYSNGCSATATSIVNVANNVDVQVSPPNADICPGQTANLTASGAGDYTWFPSTGLNTTSGNTVIANPTASTVYTVIGSSGSCIDTAFVPINVVNSLTVSVTPQTDTICPGGSTTLSASGAGTYSWFPSTGLSSTSTATVTASPTGTQTYTVIGGSAGCSATATATVVVGNALSVSVTPSNSTICPGESVALNASGANNYSWYPASGLSTNSGTTITASPTSTTTYTVIGTAGSCSAIATATVTIFNNVTISVLPNSATICPGGNAQLNASGATNYTWFPGATLDNTNSANVTATPSANTTYTVIGSTGTCADTATVTITITNNISVSTTPPQDSICLGQSSSFTLNGANTYTWFPQNNTTAIGTTGFQANPTTSTTYTVIGFSGTCSDTTFVPLIIKPIPNVTVNPANITICPGSSLQLNAGGATQYSWSPTTGLSGNTGSTVSAAPGVNTNYTVTGIQDGCSDTAIAKITVTILPSVNLSATDTNLCQGESTNIFAFGLSAFNWNPTPENIQNNGTQVTVTPSFTTIYTASGASGGCQVTKTIRINVLPNPVVNLSSVKDSVCYGSSNTLNASGATAYSWLPTGSYVQTNNNSAIISPIATNIYTVIGYAGKCKDTATKEIFVHPQVIVQAFPDTAVCPGSVVNVTATGANSYTWSNGVATATNTVTVKAPRYLTVTGFVGNCSGKDSVLLTINPTPKANFDFESNPVPAYNPNAYIIDLSSNAVGYIYTTNGLKDTVFTTPNPMITYQTENGDTFTVKQIVINQYGCTDTITKEFIIKPEFALYVPNAFTPNKDANNEGFGAKGFGINEFKMFIFDRWGNKLHEIQNLNDTWDGKVGGKEQPKDVYVWKIELKTFDNKARSFEGTFSLIR